MCIWSANLRSSALYEESFIAASRRLHATRVLLPRMWFDAAKCKVGLEALGRYRRSYNKVLGEYTEKPVHDHASHAADALRTLGIAHRAARPRPELMLSDKVGPVAPGPTAWMAI